jgi:predicted phosphoribosyltransferase
MSAMRSRKHLPPGAAFQDRREAGQWLAELLTGYGGRDDVVVLGLARGGIPVAWEVAAALDAPLDALIVRKLGVPGQEEYAMGAVAGGGHIVINDDVVRALEISPRRVADTAEREGRELLRREVMYRGGRPPPDLAGLTAIIVDDGLATGATMRVAVDAVRANQPKAVVIAVPVAPGSTCRQLSGTVDDLVCAFTPEPFRAVGEFYWEFNQVSDAEVCALLASTTVRSDRRRGE